MCVCKGDGILFTINLMLGLEGDDITYDGTIIPLINTALSILKQEGIGVKDFILTSRKDKWTDFMDNISMDIGLVHSFVYTKVKLIFDPPSSASVIKVLEETAKELEWRIYTEYNYHKE